MKMDKRLIAEKKQIQAKSVWVCEDCIFANNCPMKNEYEPIAEVSYNKDGSFKLNVFCFIPNK